jgi:hypothetical protein
MPTIDTAAVTATSFAALWVGHQIGEHAVQRRADVQTKATPDDWRLANGAHPWAGWLSCLRHTATTTATQAATLALTALVSPLTWLGVASALTISASAHAVIDRQCLVRIIIQAKHAHDWPDGPGFVAQALHHGVLLAAAVLCATVHTTAELTAEMATTAALLAGSCWLERTRALSAARRIGHPSRL